MTFFLVITASLVVLTASKQAGRAQTAAPKQQSASDSGEDINDSEEKDWDDNGPIPFDLKGNLRRALAFDTALADPIRNVICSPVAAILPVGKLVLGTDRGDSRDQLLEALGYQKNKVKMRLRSLMSKLKFLPGVTLSIASTIYISEKMQLVSKYHKDTMSVFKSSVQKIDFEIPKEAAAVINRKAFDDTHGKIIDVISPDDIPVNSSMILVNSIYFSGRWKNQFTDVKVDDFHSPAGPTKVSMLSRYGDYYYYNSEILGAQLLEIPYEGDAASFVIVLPMVQNGLTLLLRQLKVAPELLNKAVSKMREYKVFLTIPKFKVATEVDLKGLFEKIGVKHVFDKEKSSLKRITRDGKQLWVTLAKQKAIIDVSEKGADGPSHAPKLEAAVTPVNEALFKADRPFLYFVKIDGEQLFAGIFTNI